MAIPSSWAELTGWVGHIIDVLNLLRQRDINVRSVSGGIDPANSTGRLMLNMLATHADHERELIVERVNAGIAAACPERHEVWPADLRPYSDRKEDPGDRGRTHLGPHS